MKYVLIGKIVNTHGLKGEVRILSDFRYKSRVFKKNMKVYIGKSKIEEVINSYRHHKIFEMITINGINNINDVLKYKGEYIFVNKEDIILNDNEYLDEDIIGLTVKVNNNPIGVVKRFEKHSKNELLVVKKEDKDCYIPYNFDIIQSIDLKDKVMTIIDIPGLI